mgnify:FL=1
MKDILELYILQCGKLFMKDGKIYKDILFVETSRAEFTFIDTKLDIHKIDPTEIARFDFRKLHSNGKEANGKYHFGNRRS